MSFRKLIEQAMLETSADFSEIVEGKLMALLGGAAPEPAPAPNRSVKSAPVKVNSSKKSAKKTSSTTKPKGKPGRPPGSKNRAKPSGAQKTAPNKASPKKSLSKGPTKPELTSMVLAALRNGPLMKGPMMLAAGIHKRDGDRVKDVLRELRTAGKVVMTGEKNEATYGLVVSSQGAGSEVFPEG